MCFLIFAKCDALDYGRSFKLQNQILWKRKQQVWILKPRLQNTLREKHYSLQIFSLQSQRMKVNLLIMLFFFFIWSWNEGKVFEKYYFKISLSRKKIWLNHLCLAILFRAYIHSFKLDARLPEIWQIGSNHREWRFKRPLEPEMKPKLNTQLDKYSMFHMLREHQITSPLWAV